MKEVQAVELPTLHVMVSPRSPGYGWSARLLNNEPFGVGFEATGESPADLVERIRGMAEQHVELNGPRSIAAYPPAVCPKCRGPVNTADGDPFCWNCRLAPANQPIRGGDPA